jgi:GT2 family glycosyltransferase
MVTATQARATTEASPPVADLVVVVVTHNSTEQIPALLEALPAALDGAPAHRVVLVDNASTDGTAELARHLAPWALVVEAGANRGYAAGLNRGCREVRARDCVLVLNPDCRPAPGSIRHLRATLDLPSTGIAVPAIVNHEGRLKYSLRREPTLARALGEALLGGHRAARFPRWGEQVRDPSAYRDGCTSDWATGAVMLISAACWADVGPWDESFFLYSEETDYALRARDRGYLTRWSAAAVVEHPGGAMSRSPYLWSILTYNRVMLYRRRHGTVAGAAYWAVVVLNEALRARRTTHRAALKTLLTSRRPGPEG